jgi:hypothetical protein
MAVAAVYFENRFGRNLVLPLNMRPDFSGAIAIDLALLGHPDLQSESHVQHDILT